jgi:ABC-type branched-subunit amino acid transport system substrate-binding protein
MSPRRRLARRTGFAGSTVALVVALAACGSHLDADDVTAIGTTSGSQAGTVTGTSDSVVDGTDPGAGAVPVDTGAPPVTGGGTTTTGGTAAPATGGDDPEPGSAPANDPDGGVKGGACEGLKNQTGITDDSITIANASDITGPVPGLFESSQLGTQAYVDYFNATSSICGRKLKLLLLDSRSDGAGDQAAYTRACAEAFAVVGSESIFDSGGVKTAESCGIPDIRTGALTAERTGCSVCFGTQAAQVGVVTDAQYRFYRQQDQAATDNAAFLYLNIGGSPDLAKSYSEVAAATGYGVKILAGIDTAEFNYAPYVQQLKDANIEYVQFVGANVHAVRLSQAMAQQGYKPTFFVVTQTQYNTAYVESGGDAVDGTYLPLPHPLFAGAQNPELKLYTSWLQTVRPGTEPTTFGLFAWSATRLFVEKAIGLGGGLTRAALIGAVRKERSWDANGLHTPMDVGGKTTYKCLDVVQLRGSTWTKVSGSKYLCGSLVRTSVAN